MLGRRTRIVRRIEVRPAIVIVLVADKVSAPRGKERSLIGKPLILEPRDLPAKRRPYEVDLF